TARHGVYRPPPALSTLPYRPDDLEVVSERAGQAAGRAHERAHVPRSLVAVDVRAGELPADADEGAAVGGGLADEGEMRVAVGASDEAPDCLLGRPSARRRIDRGQPVRPGQAARANSGAGAARSA